MTNILTDPTAVDSLTFHRKLEELLQHERTERALNDQDPSSDFLASLDRALTRHSFSFGDPSNTLSLPPLVLSKADSSDINLSPSYTSRSTSNSSPKKKDSKLFSFFERNSSENSSNLYELERAFKRLSLETPTLLEAKNKVNRKIEEAQSKFQSKRDQLIKNIERLSSELDKLKSTSTQSVELHTISQLNSKLKQSISEIDDVALKISSNRIKKLVSNFETQLSAIQEQISLEQNTDILTHLESFVAQSKSSRDDLTQARRQTGVLNQVNHHLQSKNRQLKSELDVLRNDYHLTQSKVDQLKSLVERRKSEYHELIDRQNQQSDDVSDLSDCSDHDNEDLTIEINQSAENETESLLINQAHRLRQSINQIDQSILTAKNDLKEWKRAHLEVELLLSDSLNDLKKQICLATGNSLDRLKSTENTLDVDVWSGKGSQSIPLMVSKGRLLNLIYERIFKKSSIIDKSTKAISTPRSTRQALID
ncbi:hypothetical protein RCL1_006930 [Eukaryota sp. TZLM3-RCL]